METPKFFGTPPPYEPIPIKNNLSTFLQTGKLESLLINYSLKDDCHLEDIPGSPVSLFGESQVSTDDSFAALLSSGDLIRKNIRITLNNETSHNLHIDDDPFEKTHTSFTVTTSSVVRAVIFNLLPVNKAYELIHKLRNFRRSNIGLPPLNTKEQNTIWVGNISKAICATGLVITASIFLSNNASHDYFPSWDYNNVGSDVINIGRDTVNAVTGLETFDTAVEIGGTLKRSVSDISLVSLVAVLNNAGNYIYDNSLPQNVENNTVSNTTTEISELLEHGLQYNINLKFNWSENVILRDIQETVIYYYNFRAFYSNTIKTFISQGQTAKKFVGVVIDSKDAISNVAEIANNVMDLKDHAIALTAATVTFVAAGYSSPIISGMSLASIIWNGGNLGYDGLKINELYNSIKQKYNEHLGTVGSDENTSTKDLEDIIIKNASPLVDKFFNNTVGLVNENLKKKFYSTLFKFLKGNLIEKKNWPIEHFKWMLLMNLCDIDVEKNIKWLDSSFTKAFALLLAEENTAHLKLNSDIKKAMLLSSISVTLINKVCQQLRSSLPFPRRLITGTKFNAAVGSVMFFYGILAHDPCFAIKLASMCRPGSNGLLLGMLLQKIKIEALNVGKGEYDIKDDLNSESPLEKLKMPLNKLHAEFQYPQNFENVVSSITNDKALKGKKNEHGNNVLSRPFKYHETFDPIGKVFKTSDMPHIFKLPADGRLHLHYPGTEKTSRAELCSVYCNESVLFKHFDNKKGSYIWYESKINAQTDTEEITRLSNDTFLRSLKNDITEGFLNGFFDYFDIKSHNAQYAIYISDSLEHEPKEIFKSAVQTVENIAMEYDEQLKLIPFHIDKPNHCTIKHKLHHRFCPITVFILAKYGIVNEDTASDLKDKVLTLKKKITENSTINLILKAHPEWSESLLSKYENDDDYGGLLRNIDVKHLLEAICAIEKCKITLYSYNSLTDIEDYQPIRDFPENTSSRDSKASDTVHMGYVPIFIPYWIDNHFIPFVKTAQEIQHDMKAVEDEIKEHVMPTSSIKGLARYFYSFISAEKPDQTDCEEYAQATKKRAERLAAIKLERAAAADREAEERKERLDKEKEKKTALAAAKERLDQEKEKKIALAAAKERLNKEEEKKIQAAAKERLDKEKGKKSADPLIKNEIKNEKPTAAAKTPFEKLQSAGNDKLLKKITTYLSEQCKINSERTDNLKIKIPMKVAGSELRFGNWIKNIIDNDPVLFSDPTNPFYLQNFSDKFQALLI